MFDWFKRKEVIGSLDSWSITGRHRPVDEAQCGNVLTQIWASKATEGKLYFRVGFRRVQNNGWDIKLRDSFYPGDLEGVWQGAEWSHTWFKTNAKALKPLLFVEKETSQLVTNRRASRIFGGSGREDKRGSLEPWVVHGRQRPVEEFLFGNVLSQVWANEAKGGQFYFKVSFRRVVQTGRGFSFVHSFAPSDLADVWRGASRAYIWSRDNESVLRLLSADEKKASPAVPSRQTSRDPSRRR
jgi:hypothetical protein